ncbi:MAG: hypothetical protein V3S64_04480 [bacterium]
MTDAALPEDTAPDTEPDTGALIQFDHVNLRVDDHKIATAFFIEGLGLTRDPYRMVGTGNMWVNAGRQQFHLPLGPPTPFPGVIMLGVPDLDAVREGLGRVSDALRGTAFSWREDDGDGDAILTTTPWGHAIRIHAAVAGTEAPVLGLCSAVFRVPLGTAAGIARFYRDWLHCPVRETLGAVTYAAESRDTKTRGAATARVEVTVGPNQIFRFVETDADENSADEGATGNHHVAVYLTRYREIHQTLFDNGLVTEPHRNAQFRFNEIADPVDGARLFRLEHEMRSLYHRDYGRPLVNRIPSWEARV